MLAGPPPYAGKLFGDGAVALTGVRVRRLPRSRPIGRGARTGEALAQGSFPCKSTLDLGPRCAKVAAQGAPFCGSPAGYVGR